jgi:hypothetical protein
VAFTPLHLLLTLAYHVPIHTQGKHKEDELWTVASDRFSVTGSPRRACCTAGRYHSSPPPQDEPTTYVEQAIELDKPASPVLGTIVHGLTALAPHRNTTKSRNTEPWSTRCAGP